MLNKEFLDTLTPVEIQMVHQYINILFKNKITSSTANYRGTFEQVCQGGCL